ncbi:ParB N-terminal domain-containing protein [Candidatus Bathyarchaeota archaeon]|nr:ParB N-terminal domain-containing protein [Candidatus Bathyarchaeota archaeon]
MKLKTVKLGDLKFPEYNPRVDVHANPSFHAALSRSISEFGYVEPIIVNEKTGNIVGGSQRAKILLEQGVEEVEAVIVSLNDKREKALNLALNKIVGEWDGEKLEDLILELKDEPELELTGFSEAAVKRILEDVPEVKLEEIFQVIIACGDEKEQRQVFKNLTRQGFKCKLLTL